MQTFIFRAYSAVIQFNTRKVYSEWVNSTFNVPSNIFVQTHEKEKNNRNERNINVQRTKTNYFKKVYYVKKKDNAGYGETATRDLPRYSKSIITQLEENEIKKIIQYQKDRVNIEILTRTQNLCSLWREVRQSIVTASQVGKIVKSRSSSSYKGYMKSSMAVISSNIPSISHGLHFEQVAKQKFEKDSGM